MRKELEIIQIIEKYLNNELSPTDRAKFEEKLSTNSKLAEEVEKQRLVQEGVKNIALKTTIQKAWKAYKLGKFGFLGGMGLLVVVGIGLGIMYFSSPDTNTNESWFDENIKYSLNENQEEVWTDADEYLTPQFFEINANEDQVLQTENGITIAIPKGALLQNGKPVTGKVEIEFKEALNPEDILQSGLTTMPGDQLLETGGMFYFNARKDGENLTIDPNIGVGVDVPSNGDTEGMQLYDGVRKEDGSIDWQNPKPLEDFLTTVDIFSLDFYPPGYEARVNQLGHRDKNKAWRDSLYYSFASPEIMVTSEVNPVSWGCEVYKNQEGNYVVHLIAQIEPGFHIYDLSLQGDTGPIPTSIEFDIPSKFKIGPLVKDKFNKVFDPVWESEISSIQNKASFFQTISKEYQGILNINISYMTCNESSCIFPDPVQFSTRLPEQSLRYQNKNLIFSSINNPESNFQISPSKIQTIWSEKYQNTLIATKEFEQRLRYIFQSCNDRVLDLYVNNLDKRMATIDSMVVELLCGENYMSMMLQQQALFSRDTNDQSPLDSGEFQGGEVDSTMVIVPVEDTPMSLCDIFLKFARENKGRVEGGDEVAQLLAAHYEKQSKAFAQAAKATQQRMDQQYAQVLDEINDAKVEKAKQETERKNKNYEEEYNLNLEEACRQLGIKKPPVRPSSARNTARITSPGWKNIDRAVAESVSKRTTLDFKDQKGRTAKIEYQEITVKVMNESEYDRVMVYLLPDQLNSFQRIMKKGGIFKNTLNELINYNLLVVGYKNDQIYTSKVESVIPKSYELSLKASSQKELKKELNGFGKKSITQSINDEVKYQQMMYELTQEKTNYESMQAFRSKIEQVIFPCAIQSFTKMDTVGISEVIHKPKIPASTQ